MKRVRIVYLEDRHDKDVLLVGPYSSMPYDEEVQIVGLGEPCDWAVRVTTDITHRVDLKVKVVNPSAIPSQYRRALGPCPERP